MKRTSGHMKRTSQLLAAVFVVAACAPSVARADLITFNSVASVGNPIITTLLTQGFTFTSGHFHTIDTPLGLSNGNGTIYIAEEGGALGQPITMTGTTAFSFGGFDAGGLFNPPVAGFPDATVISVIGNLFGGGTLTAAFTLNGPNFTSFLLPASWTNLSSVQFTGMIPSVSSNAGFGLDNIVVNQATTVPEPGSLTLLGSGLLTLAGVFMRGRRSNAERVGNISMLRRRSTPGWPPSP